MIRSFTIALGLLFAGVSVSAAADPRDEVSVGVIATAFKDVPAEIFEAARIDGAGRFRVATAITLPLIRDNVQTAWIYLGILALDAFVYMAALNPGGGPNNSTLVMAQQLFTTAFTKGQFGLACAMGVVLAAVTLLFSALVFVVNRLLGGKADAR